MLGVIDTEHAQPMLFPKVDTNTYGATCNMARRESVSLLYKLKTYIK